MSEGDRRHHPPVGRGLGNRNLFTEGELMSLETIAQHQSDSEVHLPGGDRDPVPTATGPDIPPATQMSPPPRDGDGDDQ